MNEMAVVADQSAPPALRRIALRNGSSSKSEPHNGTRHNGQAAAPSFTEVAERESIASPDEREAPPASRAASGGVAAEAAEALIEHKRIGRRIKFLRQRKHMGLVELGRYTGLSASFLSQLETGRVVPTLRNLARVAMVFSKDLSYFFEPERAELFQIVRAAERQRLPQTGANDPDYFFESLGHVPGDQVALYLAEFLPSNGRRPAAHQHTGAEFLYVLSGRLRITHDDRSETMEQGDAVYFDPSAKHSYERLGDEPCTALILTRPEPLSNGHAGLRPALSAATNGNGNGNGSPRQER
ncbi:MAG TPA: XRE family transcriptional regulator [Acidobacteriaceae bacterium]|jgi:transcriptional regulator with XRE-family HTH domain|nr:XRE family transcriptional regulator [Acidobacteriaceae bacterium]